MSVKRKDLDADRIDFSDVATGRRLSSIHPGRILRDDFLRPMKISVYGLAQAIRVSRSRVNDIVLARRGITVDIAFRLARYFGTTPDYWINLQTRHDLDKAGREFRRRVEREVMPRSEKPQTSAKHRRSVVTVFTADEHERLRKPRQPQALTFVEMLRAMPQGDIELEQDQRPLHERIAAIAADAAALRGSKTKRSAKKRAKRATVVNRSPVEKTVTKVKRLGLSRRNEAARLIREDRDR